MSEFISFLPPPGVALASYDSKELHTSQPADVPEVFCDAMSVRDEVFVQEQNIPRENEYDLDDARSFHWVAYASVGTSSQEQQAAAASTTINGHSGGRKGSTANKLAVGTVRLVPPPHPPHPAPQSHHAIDNHDGLPGDSNPTAAIAHDSKEPYIKLGRLSVLPPFRGLGLARLLINAALSWVAQNPQAIVPPLSPAAAEQRRLELGADTEQNLFTGLVLVHAQKSVEKMWARHGFVKDDSMGVWFEEGIEHVGMWKRIELQPEGRRGSV